MHPTDDRPPTFTTSAPSPTRHQTHDTPAASRSRAPLSARLSAQAPLALGILPAHLHPTCTSFRWCTWPWIALITVFVGAPTNPTSAHQPEDTDSASPIIRWFALDFCGDAHSEALSSDGWRWRAASFLLSSLFVCLFLAVYKAVAETVLPALQPVIWLAGVCLTATILALDQRCACSLRRSDVATMLHVVAHLVLLFGSCSFLFSGASLTPAGAQVRVISRLAPLNSSSAHNT